ncbi:histidine phosphatase family protein [Demequina sp. NBRC 110052]|uniref:histidine phosphatase family protein n=1 Tax=Demequina sp. NBRC 110052 TaxID=1570341 RepID=UPI000A028B71|nr:histidine phosphatase family protein [Demequina sp. NBRC 110052]
MPAVNSGTGDAGAVAPVGEAWAQGLVSPLTLVFVRHGVTDMTVAHRFSGGGVAGPPLNAAGRVQAAKAADAVHSIGRRSFMGVAPVSRVLASPMTRTQDTGGAIGRRIGAHVETEPRLHEVDFGAWDGLTSDGIVARDGAEALAAWRAGEAAAPDGESLPQVGARVDDLVTDLARAHADACAADDAAATLALASHAVVIKAAVGVSLGAAVGAWGRIWPAPASLTVLQLRVTADGEIAQRHVLAVGVPTH